MPLINGLKMACEPCIRGHRSTKCTHADERLMVPVRKPGRPLSSCPHPASRSCSCAAVTAAIPRKQKCSCGPSSTAATAAELKAESSTDSDTPAVDTTPPSPSRAPPNPGSSHRVQKSASRGTTSRKQSVGAASLERMDSSQLNILPAYDGMQQKAPQVPNGHMTPPMAVPPYAAVGMTPADSGFNPQPMMFPMFQPQMSTAMMESQAPKPMANGHNSATNGSAENDTSSATGGCCAGKAAARDTTTTPPTPATATIANGTSKEETSKSCCAPAVPSPETKPQPDLMPAPEIPAQAGGVMMAPFQTPIAMPNGMYSYFPQPTIFTYPPQYGSYLQPLQPEQWRHVMAALSFGQPTPPNAFAMPGPMAFPSQASTPQATPNTAAGTSHQCTCGDSCQCVGCAAHPYNEATQNYVRSAWRTMNEDAQSVQDYANGSNGHGTAVNGTPKSNGVSTPAVNPVEGSISPTAPQTPSDAASGTTEEQTLSANDFFFVSYPFGETCAGEPASCPCGDDCQCIGCAIHNNPAPDETTE